MPTSRPNADLTLSSSTISILCVAVGVFWAACGIVLWIGFGSPHGMVVTEIQGTWRNTHRWRPIVLVLLLSLILESIFVTRLRMPLRLRQISEQIWRRVCYLLALGGFALSMFAVCVLRAFPNSGDEYVYTFQARTFLAGHLWNVLLPGHEFFSLFHVIEKDGRWVSQYPPGWPLLLAGLHLLGVPFWMASPILTFALLVVLARFCHYTDGATASIIALVLMAVSPFFAFNAGSVYSHTAVALCGLLFCYFATKFIDRPEFRAALFTGASLGALGLIRSFDVVFFALPFAVELVARIPKNRYWQLLAIALGGAPFLAALLLYNRAITGDAFLPVFKWGFPQLNIGLHPSDEWGIQASLRNTMGFALTHILELAEWTSPVLVLAYVPALFWKIARSKVRFFDFIFPATLLAYLLFAHLGGNRYGPRYYFDSYPLFVMTIAVMIDGLLKEQRDNIVGVATEGLVAAHLAICLASLVVLSIFMRQVVDERMDLYDQVRWAGLHNAVVIVRSNTGFLRPMPGPALTRNGIGRDGDVIYVNDLPGRVCDLRTLFPARLMYVYERDKDQLHGNLIRIGTEGTTQLK